MKKPLWVSLLSVIMVVTVTATTAFAVEANGESAWYTSEEAAINNEHRAELRAIWDSYSANDTNTVAMQMKTSSIGGCGDILLALDSITDHVGIVVDSYTVIEAHPDNPNKGVDYRDNNWPSRYNRIKGLQVDNSTSSEKSNAVAYADKQIGKPYNLLTTHWTEDEWYCSKLVWRAWYEQGYDIEGRTYEPRGTHVTPGDILDSPLTSVFYSSDT